MSLANDIDVLVRQVDVNDPVVILAPESFVRAAKIPGMRHAVIEFVPADFDVRIAIDSLCIALPRPELDDLDFKLRLGRADPRYGRVQVHRTERRTLHLAGEDRDDVPECRGRVSRDQPRGAAAEDR